MGPGQKRTAPITRQHRLSFPSSFLPTQHPGSHCSQPFLINQLNNQEHLKLKLFYRKVPTHTLSFSHPVTSLSLFSKLKNIHVAPHHCMHVAAQGISSVCQELCQACYKDLKDGECAFPSSPLIFTVLQSILWYQTNELSVTADHRRDILPSQLCNDVNTLCSENGEKVNNSLIKNLHDVINHHIALVQTDMNLLRSFRGIFSLISPNLKLSHCCLLTTHKYYAEPPLKE